MTPATRLRIELSEARDRGLPFEDVWSHALEGALDGAPRKAEWDVALTWARSAFETAYRRRGSTRLDDAMEAWRLAELVADTAPRETRTLIA